MPRKSKEKKKVVSKVPWHFSVSEHVDGHENGGKGYGLIKVFFFVGHVGGKVVPLE